MLEPFGENELDLISLDQLWKKANVGHQYCQRFTEYAIANDKNYPALAMAKSMKNLALGVKYAIDEQFGELLNAKVYDNIKVEANELLPHLRVLSGGQMRKEAAKLNAYRVSPIENGFAEGSAKFVYSWLPQKTI